MIRSDSSGKGGPVAVGRSSPRQGWVQWGIWAAGIGLNAAVLLMALRPGWGAERVAFSFFPLEFYLSVDTLEAFALEGQITEEFAFYARQMSPAQREALAEMLRHPFDISPVALSQVTYAPAGEVLLEQLGEILRTPSNQNGFPALRASLIAAAAASEGFTILDMLEAFPLDTLHIDLRRGLPAFGALGELMGDKEAAIATIEHQARQAAAAETLPADLSDLRTPGPYAWRQETRTVAYPAHPQGITADLYRPQVPATTAGGAVPLIVISHGFGSDRASFTYLATHLASHGLAVAALDHPDTHTTDMAALLSDFVQPIPTPTLLRQSAEITALLDDLAARPPASAPDLPPLDGTRVGLIGYSLGGYNALVLGGAMVKVPQTAARCQQPGAGPTFNLSVALQCQAAQFTSPAYSGRDERVKAVLAISPPTSYLLGAEGLQDLAVPTLLVSSGQDFLTPPLAEQIRPFTQLPVAERYLLVHPTGTHFSFLDPNLPTAARPSLASELMGPAPQQATTHLQALSLAFFRTHVQEDDSYRPYLTSAYSQSLGDPLNLSLIQSLSAEQLAAATATSPF